MHAHLFKKNLGFLGARCTEAQQNKILNHIQEPGTYTGHHQFQGAPTIYGGKVILKRHVSRFLRKEARLSQDFNVVGSSFQRMGAATEKARLPRFSLIMGIESCFEVDVLSCLGMLEKCRRLAR